jgi:16S rRNA A1518/A1519 N6-dimethyltransferase RsmA/KsgA/DIM1 with predicted DNA glycosylase/AP lyase activity
MPVRKRFGQHFLHDPGIIRRIIDAVAPQPASASSKWVPAAAR